MNVVGDEESVKHGAGRPIHMTGSGILLSNAPGADRINKRPAPIGRYGA